MIWHRNSANIPFLIEKFCWFWLSNGSDLTLREKDYPTPIKGILASSLWETDETGMKQEMAVSKRYDCFCFHEGIQVQIWVVCDHWYKLRWQCFTDHFKIKFTLIAKQIKGRLKHLKKLLFASNFSHSPD